MAKLNMAARKKLKKAVFGQPKKLGFPMNDPTHQRLAIGGATRSYHAGNISEGEMERLQAKARRLLGKGK